MRALVALAYLSSASALQLPQQASASMQRRGFLAGVAVMIPGAALAEGTPDTTALNRQLHSSGVNPFNSACMGFGCADAGGLDFNGAPAPLAGVPSIAYPDFLKALDNNEVESVDFLPPNGDEAYAKLKGKDEPIFIGEGWPTERNDGWSSPLFVMRILDNKGVPHKFKFEKKPYTGYQPQPKYAPPAKSSSSFNPLVAKTLSSS